MSSHYTTEPPPTASVTLYTTAGPIPLSLFATQTPLTTRNFLQHCLDGYYDGCLWHRVVAGFVAQTGDPTGTGEGGGNIYEDQEFGRFDREWAKVLGREEGENIVFGDEVHGRLRFNRRGLLGMARQEDGGMGVSFLLRWGIVEVSWMGGVRCLGGWREGVYNMVKIAEGEVDGERPLFPERVLRTEITEMPVGEAWEGMRRRERVEARVVEVVKREKKKAGRKGKGTLLSFGQDGEEGDVLIKPRKAKFNTALIDAGGSLEGEPRTQTQTNGHKTREADVPPLAKRRKPSVSPSRREKLLASITAQSSGALSQRRPSFHEPTTQLPLRDEEMPSRSESPDSPIETKGPSRTSLEAEIAALKASMRRDTAPVATKNKKLSALEAMIPATSTRGRKRPRPGEMNQNGREDKNALALLNAFKARLDAVKDVVEGPDTGSKQMKDLKLEPSDLTKDIGEDAEEEDEEAHLCDLHFIANCQSCSKWDENLDDDDKDDGQDGTDWMSHKLAFGRDQLGKDLNFKKRKEALEELVVIDPREKAGQILAAEREKQRLRKEERRGGDETETRIAL